MNKLFILLGLMTFFSSKSMENIENNKGNKTCNSGKCVKNFIDDNFRISNDQQDSNNLKLESLFNKISAKIQNIHNFSDGFKIIFDLEEDLKSKLLGVDVNNFKIFIESEGTLIDDVFLTWKDENNIKNGMTLFEIKKHFLKYNRFSPNSDPYSFSVKLNKEFDINKKITIFIKYKSDIFEQNDNNDVVIIPVKNVKGEEEFTLFSLIYDDIPKYDELFEIIKNNSYCTSIYGKENSIKLIFPENDKLLNNKFRDLLKIFVEDEMGNEISDSILLRWIDNEKIENNSLLKDIKKSFFVIYKDNKYNTEQKPYQISMFFDKSKYKKVKIKIKYIDDKFFYIKNNGSEIIDLDNLEKPKFECKIDKFDESKNKLTEAQFKDKFKNLISKGISVETVGKIKDSIKVKFNVDEDLIGESYRNNIKIQYFDEKDNLLTESLFYKWNSDIEIKNNSKLTDIKNGFLYKFPQYPVETSKLFEISMIINKNIKNKKVKIKISYNDEFGEFVKNKGLEIIDLNDLEQSKFENKIDKFDESNNKLSEEQFKDKFKNILSKGISCEKVGFFKNSFKIKFNVDEDLIGESYRNNIKIQYFDEKDNLLTESLFYKWNSDIEIKNNSKLVNIKSGFLFKFPKYPVETSKLFEISMIINKNIKNKKVKIKISYNDEFGEFVKNKGSEIIDLNDFK